MSTRDLILASSSPRRRELLGQIGVKFRIEKPDIDEVRAEGETGATYVCRLAEEKASVVAQRQESSVVLAADTTVVLDGDILEKPLSDRHGIEMLRRLSGNMHEVLTGVALIDGQKRKSFVCSSRVFFRELSDEEIVWYWNTGEPLDKAGGYGLQGIGAAFVTAIEGSYTNVIGLPLAETVLLLRDFGINLMQDKEINGSGAEGRRYG